MKKNLIIVTTLIAALCCALSAAAMDASINPEKDAVFSCNSDPADFNGKTFENLYVLLKGCTNFESTIIPGNETFVTLSDITVNGALYFTDDQYDQETNTYKKADLWNNVTYTHSYLNIAGNSYVSSLYVECLGPHTCNVGLQSPSIVVDMYLYPVNWNGKGNIALRGHIKPFVDPDTDYYKDAKVASYPNFTNIDTYIDEMVSQEVFDDWQYDVFSENYAKYVYYMLRGDEQKALDFVKKYQDMLDRAVIERLHIHNAYLANKGETVIDLGHVQCDVVDIVNGFYQGEKYEEAYGTGWKPVLRSTGFSNAGAIFLYAPYLKLDAKTASKTQNITSFMPMNADALVVDTDGRKVSIEIGYAKVGILDSFTGVSANGSLELKFNNDNRYSREGNLFSQVGALLVHGGEITLAQQRGYDAPSIGKVALLGGRQDASIKTENPLEFVNNLWKDVCKTGERFIPEKIELSEETFAFNDFYNYDNEDLKNRMFTYKKGYAYYYWGSYDWDNYINNMPAKDESAPSLKVHANKITVGEGCSNANWSYDGFCYGMVPFDNPSGIVHFKPLVRQ